MNSETYIKELKSYLVYIDNNTRNNIIKEIQSYIDEKNPTYNTLVENFGTSEELANSYLENIPQKVPLKSTIMSKSKKVFLVIGIIFIFLLVFITSSIYFFTKDPFDYSKYNAANIKTKIDYSWKTVNYIDNININQSKVIFYWSDENNIKYACEDDLNYKINEKVFNIKQSHCYVILPRKTMNINAYQSSINLIAPKENINLELEQVSLNIAQNNNPYKYTIIKKESNVEDLISKDSSVLIKLNLTQSQVKEYEY